MKRNRVTIRNRRRRLVSPKRGSVPASPHLVRRVLVGFGAIVIGVATWLSIPQWAIASPAPEEQRASRWFHQARDSMHRFLFSKRVAIKGLDDTDETIRRALPEDRSVAWWLLNRSSIGAQLSMLPRVESAAIRRVPMNGVCAVSRFI